MISKIIIFRINHVWTEEMGFSFEVWEKASIERLGYWKSRGTRVFCVAVSTKAVCIPGIQSYLLKRVVKVFCDRDWGTPWNGKEREVWFLFEHYFYSGITISFVVTSMYTGKCRASVFGLTVIVSTSWTVRSEGLLTVSLHLIVLNWRVEYWIITSSQMVKRFYFLIISSHSNYWNYIIGGIHSSRRGRGQLIMQICFSIHLSTDFTPPPSWDAYFWNGL